MKELYKNEEKLVAYLNELKDVIKDRKELSLETLQEQALSILKQLAKQGIIGNPNVISINNSSIYDAINMVFKHLRKLDIECSSVTLGVFLLLSPHVSSTKYPEVNQNPLEVYAENMPLVKHLGEILDVVNNALERMK